MREILSISILSTWKKKKKRRATRRDGTVLAGRGAKAAKKRFSKDGVTTVCMTGLVFLLAGSSVLRSAS